MKAYIIFDMEGCSGIFDWRQVTLSDPCSAAARRAATLDLNAVVQGALAGGATEVIAWDGHGNYPGSLDLELLHPACQLLDRSSEDCSPTAWSCALQRKRVPNFELAPPAPWASLAALGLLAWRSHIAW